MKTLVDDLHAAYSNETDEETSERETLLQKRTELNKEKAALVRELRNEKRRTQRIKEKTKLLSENDLIEAWSLRFGENSAKPESESKKRKSSASA